jgi:hypothetical protein
VNNKQHVAEYQEQYSVILIKYYLTDDVVFPKVLTFVCQILRRSSFSLQRSMSLISLHCHIPVIIDEAAFRVWIRKLQLRLCIVSELPLEVRHSRLSKLPAAGSPVSSHVT